MGSPELKLAWLVVLILAPLGAMGADIVRRPRRVGPWWGLAPLGGLPIPWIVATGGRGGWFANVVERPSEVAAVWAGVAAELTWTTAVALLVARVLIPGEPLPHGRSWPGWAVLGSSLALLWVEPEVRSLGIGWFVLAATAFLRRLRNGPRVHAALPALSGLVLAGATFALAEVLVPVVSWYVLWPYGGGFEIPSLRWLLGWGGLTLGALAVLGRPGGWATLVVPGLVPLVVPVVGWWAMGLGLPDDLPRWVDLEGRPGALPLPPAEFHVGLSASTPLSCCGAGSCCSRMGNGDLYQMPIGVDDGRRALPFEMGVPSSAVTVRAAAGGATVDGEGPFALGAPLAHRLRGVDTRTPLAVEAHPDWTLQDFVSMCATLPPSVASRERRCWLVVGP
ncbi:MAG: hypothetical protein KC656_04315 [Myxococcales bacterium]|nr:hypothetical protein [Myxococcales bacterium]MCB9672209.1 hypothetical protein [Alphaproteobacteria bacterium]MCB9694079.1 hypothetical protein [Alphaproteobacteria bacterium]